MDNKVFKTQTSPCPIVSVGMYESLLDPKYMFYNDDEEGNVNWDKWDAKKYIKAVGAEAANLVNRISETILSEEVKKKYGIVSFSSDGGVIRPHYHGYIAYNFGTDQLNLDIEVSGDFVKTAVSNLERWSRGECAASKYFEEHFLSGYGFSSFLPQSLERFTEAMSDLENYYDADLLVGAYAAMCLAEMGYFTKKESTGESDFDEYYQKLVENLSEHWDYSEFYEDGYRESVEQSIIEEVNGGAE